MPPATSRPHFPRRDGFKQFSDDGLTSAREVKMRHFTDAGVVSAARDSRP